MHSALRQDLEVTYARYDEDETNCDELTAELVAIEEELVDRGLEVPELSGRSTYQPGDVEPVLAPEAAPAVDRSGPAIEP